MYTKSLLLALLFASQACANPKRYKYVLTISVDGLHASDVTKYVAKKPKSNLAELLENAYEYTNCFTTGPSDSFPGTMALVTGASPRTTGIWYDDAYDRKYFPPFSVSKKNCSGPPGSEVFYAENLDYDFNRLFSGGIDPKNLSQTLENGVCKYVKPHERLRVNTIFEVVEAHGKQTAYADKHPAYDIVRGPSGRGLSVGYFPEINSLDTTKIDQILGWDQLHLDAFLDWINGTTPANSEIQDKLTGTPTLFGGNLQSVSVGQKTAGYVAGSLDFTPNLLKAMDFVDGAIGQIVDALSDKRIHHETLIIIASKHGQSPIDPTKYAKISGKLVTAAAGVTIAQTTTDDIALLWLSKSSDTAAAVAGLNAKRSALAIKDIIYGQALIDGGYGDPLKDSAVPDIIVVPVPGIIYTGSTAKIAEHGGLSDDDRHVACIAASPNLKRKQFKKEVSTRSVAPTILQVLGFEPEALKGAVTEATPLLTGFRDDEDEDEDEDA